MEELIWFLNRSVRGNYTITNIKSQTNQTQLYLAVLYYQIISYNYSTTISANIVSNNMVVMIWYQIYEVLSDTIFIGLIHKVI